MNENDLDRRIADALERVGQALRVQLWDAAKEQSLTPTQLQVLLRLATDPPRLRRVGALAEQLDVTHPTISDAVGALRRKGLVDRETESRRSPLILTIEGREVAGALAGWQDRTIDQLSELPSEDKEVTLRTLLSLIAGLQREGAITVARMCSTCRFFERDAHPGETPHHCGLLDIPLADADLRVDCPEHQPAA
ncbi:MAG: winged helix-turn-helix transcriptional regulator [Solirubrobacterales bacterium]|nr:winged helix-turn-helix transcriptional regulator [Solirubrobacterales bacterium]